MFIPILTILIGALLTAAGAQELVVQGILNNRLFPLVGGTLGTVGTLGMFGTHNSKVRMDI